MEGAHLCHKRPGRSVVPEASSKVNGMVEGRGSGGEMGTSKELAEKLEGFWSVVPEPFYGVVDERLGPFKLLECLR